MLHDFFYYLPASICLIAYFFAIFKHAHLNSTRYFLSFTACLFVCCLTEVIYLKQVETPILYMVLDSLALPVFTISLPLVYNWLRELTGEHSFAPKYRILFYIEPVLLALTWGTCYWMMYTYSPELVEEAGFGNIVNFDLANQTAAERVYNIAYMIHLVYMSALLLMIFIFCNKEMIRLEKMKEKWAAVPYLKISIIGILSLTLVIVTRSIILCVLNVEMNVFWGCFYMTLLSIFLFVTFFGGMLSTMMFALRPMALHYSITSSKYYKDALVKFEDLMLNKGVCYQKGLTDQFVGESIGLNHTYLDCLVSEAYGQSFDEWVRDQRTRKAKELMDTYPQLSLSEISEKVGFRNMARLIMSYERMYGVSIRSLGRNVK